MGSNCQSNNWTRLLRTVSSIVRLCYHGSRYCCPSQCSTWPAILIELAHNSQFRRIRLRR